MSSEPVSDIAHKLRILIESQHNLVEYLCAKVKSKDAYFELPFRVNCSLSLEYILKYMGLFNGMKIKKSHNLKNLFDRIGKTNAQIIGNKFEVAYRDKTGEEINFQDSIRLHSNDFVRWRYLDKFRIEDLGDSSKDDYLHNFMHSLERILYDVYATYLRGLDIEPDKHLVLSEISAENGEIKVDYIDK